ncbi:partial Alpha-D-kanosaminyltransferase, partial [Anaerolineae bacterium]
ERLIDKEGLGGKVILAGFRKDIPAVMGSLDVVVHASIRPDALPTVILEAMFMGKPVVASNVGGVPEIIEDGRSGFIVPPADPSALSAAMSKLLRDKALRERMGEQGRRTLLANFRAEDYLRKVFGLYSELLGENKFQEKLTHG